MNKRGIGFSEDSFPALDSANTHSSKRYVYQKNGETRFAYETTHRIAVDDYVIVSVLFSVEEPTTETIIEKINSKR